MIWHISGIQTDLNEDLTHVVLKECGLQNGAGVQAGKCSDLMCKISFTSAPKAPSGKS